MKLKTFNTENTYSKRESKPFILVSQKTGLFGFNKGVNQLLALKAGDQLQFHQDEENPDEWYLEKVKQGGFTLRDYKGGSLLLNNTTLARKIFESVECEKRSGRLIIGAELKVGKQTLHTIITASLK
jgi:hypothetical protein